MLRRYGFCFNGSTDNSIKACPHRTSTDVVGLSKADPLVVQATDEFVDGLMDKAPQMQKQQLGEKLFKVVKSFGIKGAVSVMLSLSSLQISSSSIN